MLSPSARGGTDITFTYSPTVLTTELAMIRRLINDTDSANAIFSDEEIEGMLVFEGSNVRRAAALAMETIAASQAYVLKVMTRGDLSTNGKAVSDALLARAELLREQADRTETDEDGGFDWAEMVTNDFSARERLWDQALRGQLA